MARKITAPVYLKNRAAVAHAHYTAVKLQLSPSVTAVYKFLASATDYGTWARATNCIRQICDRVHYCRSAVAKALRLLRDLGLIARDGRGPSRGALGGRRIVFYRLASTPDAPLPEHVLCAREAHNPDHACTHCLTSENTHTPKNPKGSPLASRTQPHLPQTALSRSAEGVRSAPGHHRGDVNAKPAPRTRHEPTQPKGRPTPRRAPTPPRAIRPALELVAHVYARLTPGQQRLVHRRLNDTMRTQGIGPARMAERLRHWRIDNPDDPVGWLLYAMGAQPHGCPRPDCENGVLWDPAVDMPVGPCEGCAARIQSRAIRRKLPDESLVTWPPPREPRRLVDCDWCETPMENPPSGTYLCRDCRTGAPA